MSQHQSLKIDSVGAKHRNVLKRYERIKKMQDDNRWSAANSVYHLPKIKSLKVKVKKSASPKEGAAGEAGTKPEAGAPTAGKSVAKPAAKPAAAAAAQAKPAAKPGAKK